MSIRAVVVDDEAQSRVSLIGDLAEVCPDVEIVGEAHNAASAITTIRALRPDAVFLDVQLGDGTGFSVLEALRDLDFKVIFTTAYNEFAIKAFRFSASDYLLKPIDVDELSAAVGKVRSIATSDQAQLLTALLENMQRPGTPGKVVLKAQEGIHIVPADEVLRCESDGNYCKVFMVNAPTLLLAKTMKELENQLGGSGFERSHHSHLVNLAHVRQYVPRDGGYLLLSDGCTIPVAQRKRAQVLKAIDRLQQ